MSRFLFAEAFTVANSADSVAFMDKNVADKLGYPRAMYHDNGAHFKRFFSARLKQMDVKQMWAPVSHPSSVGLAERYVQLILRMLRAILQHHAEAILVWDEYIPAIVRAINTRYIKVFGHSPAEILFGFLPKYHPGGDEYDEVLRSRAIESEIQSLMSREALTVEEATYESRMATLDEIRQIALRKRYEKAEKDATLTNEKSKSPYKTRPLRKGDLVKLRRLDQDNQKLHKMEPRWEGPYRAEKISEHGYSVWLRDTITNEMKGKYHADDVALWLERTEHNDDGVIWMSVAQQNREQRQLVRKWIGENRESKKVAMNSKGLDSSDFRENDGIDKPDERKSSDVYEGPFGDENEFDF